MPKQAVTSPKLRDPQGSYSHAIVVTGPGRFVFVSGMTARKADGSIAGIGDIAAQTRQVCENLEAALEAAGGSLDDVCSIDVFVRNIEHMDTIRKVRREYFRGVAPASTMVEVTKLAMPELLIEISAIASLP